jgi:hypothetical protein
LEVIYLEDLEGDEDNLKMGVRVMDCEDSRRIQIVSGSYTVADLGISCVAL